MWIDFRNEFEILFVSISALIPKQRTLMVQTFLDSDGFSSLKNLLPTQLNREN
jgi:hypothetical protein